MKLQIRDKYYQAAIILILGSFIVIAIPFTINLGDTTTAACIIAGMVLMMTGSFILILSGREPMDPRVIGFFPAQGSLILCGILSDMRITGNAHFLPPRFTTNPRVLQLNPCNEYDGSKILSEKSISTTDPRGFLTVPSCDLHVKELKQKNAMMIPELPEEITVLLNETIADIFEFASRVSATWSGNLVTITIYEYQFIESCQILTQNSPDCCKKSPCPVCSLCGVLIAEGMNEIIAVEQCSNTTPSRDVTITFRIKSLPYRNM